MLNANANYIGFGKEPRVAFNTPYYSTYIDGDYQVVKFWYESGSAVSGNGTGSFYLPYTRQVQYLIIGGGGAGGGSDIGIKPCAGGGGAGQLLSGSFLYLANQQFNFNVGRGGVGVKIGSPQSTQGYNGLTTFLSGVTGTGQVTFTAIGGGGGGAFVRNGNSPPPDYSGASGSNGGSGGGGGWIGTDSPATAYQSGISLAMSGSNGGNGYTDAVYYGAGGGGGGALGSGSVGYLTGSNTIYGGNGGSGSFSAISGSARYYAGGGAGGGYYYPFYYNSGLGGVGGGGTTQVNGEEQTGAGGGSDANGGSGVIILRWNIKQTNL